MVKPPLLDVNMLLALLWPRHAAHKAAQAWFARTGKQGWATCPFTQTGFVRLMCNPALSQGTLKPWEAVEVLGENLRHPAHEFWEADLSFQDAVRPFRERLHGHRQITDAYLLGIAMQRKSRLVTLDRSIAYLLPQEGAGRRSAVEVIGE